MISFIVATFPTLAPIIGWLGLGGALTVGFAAAAYFLPGFRRLFIELSIVVAVATFLYGKGVHDNAMFEKAKQSAVEKAVIKSGTDARTSADRDANSGVRLPEFDRDK